MSYHPYSKFKHDPKDPKDRNIMIYHDTLERCRKMRFPVLPPIKYQYDSDDFVGDGIFQSAFAEPAEIIVENMDSFDMARMFGTNNVLVLNLASHMRGGGGVRHGAKAQEEDLYRKSNYFEANDQRFYPLAMADVVYSPMVHIVKDSNYKILENPYPVSCLAVAAIRNPKVIHGQDGREFYQNPSDKLLMQKKIDMIFKVAYKHGHQHLVLGALGCGAFHNPPEEVALMFKDAVNRYKSYFKKIGFAIFSPPGNSNYTKFASLISP